MPDEAVRAARQELPRCHTNGSGLQFNLNWSAIQFVFRSNPNCFAAQFKLNYSAKEIVLPRCSCCMATKSRCPYKRVLLP
jgi:hypothetical protein